MSPLISGLTTVASLVFNAVSSGSGKSSRSGVKLAMTYTAPPGSMR